MRGFEIVDEFETLVNPGMAMGPGVAALTGLEDRQLRGAPPPSVAVSRFLAWAGDAVLVAHNARFDLVVPRPRDRAADRVAASPRRSSTPCRSRGGCSAGRVPRASLAQLSYFLGTSVQPCHRALPDAQATAEVLLALIGLAQERGARTVSDLVGARRDAAGGASGTSGQLAFGAPARPGVYLFHDRNGQLLYVGRARDLRARLRSYFRSERQRPAVEAALAAVERIEWRVLGSELEAALEELRLIRELRPPANARVARPERYVWLKKARRRRRRVVDADGARPDPLATARAAGGAALARRTTSSGRRSRCRGCGGGSPSSPRRGDTRTQRGCATASMRSSASAASSSG